MRTASKCFMPLGVFSERRRKVKPEISWFLKTLLLSNRNVSLLSEVSWMVKVGTNLLSIKEWKALESKLWFKTTTWVKISNKDIQHSTGDYSIIL